MELYGKMFTSELDMQRVEDFYKLYYFWKLRKRLRPDLNTEVSVCYLVG